MSGPSTEGWGEKLQAVAARLADGFAAMDPGDRGRLMVIAAVAVIGCLVLAIPPARGRAAAVWPRVWACGTLGGLGALLVLWLH